LLLFVRDILVVRERDIVDEVDTDIDLVFVTVPERVFAYDDAIAVPEREYVGDIEYDSDTEGVRVKGAVVGIPERVIVTVPEVVTRLDGCTVVTPDGEPLILLVLVSVIVTDGVGVKGAVVGIEDRVNVTVTDLVIDNDFD